MKARLNFGEKIVNIPVLAAKIAVKSATKNQLAALLLIAADPSISLSALAEELTVSPDEALTYVDFWKQTGVLTYRLSKGEHPQKQNAEKPDQSAPSNTASHESPKMSASEIPDYTLEQSADFLERTPSASGVIDCCSQILGKLLTPAEIKTVIGLMDYLAVSSDYILLLCAYCASIEKKSLRYIEKTAISLYDKGITEYTELDAYLEKKKAADTAESKLKVLFGIGERALSKREKECFFKWIGEWNCPLDVINEAYEITITNTSKPSVPYADKILEKWHENGYSSLAEIRTALESYKKSKESATGTFNTDDFFEAALKRSYT